MLADRVSCKVEERHLQSGGNTNFGRFFELQRQARALRVVVAPPAIEQLFQHVALISLCSSRKFPDQARLVKRLRSRTASEIHRFRRKPSRKDSLPAFSVAARRPS